ncbi:hypothetical protein BDW62DRAFT_9050 [Aspergillus aurantiobrunneus]
MVQRNRIIELFVLILHLHTLQTAATCYTPDGTKVTDPKYQPCISVENEFSMCCRLNDTDPDQCLQNGLCYWTSRNEDWRDYCTDKPGIAQINGGSSKGTARLSKCNDGTYCCGLTDNCCTAVGEFSLAETLVTIGNESSVATVTAATTGGSAGEISKLLPVGVSLGVLSVVMLGAGFLWGRRKTRAKYEGLPVQKPVTAPGGHMMFAAPQLHGSNPIYEANNSQIGIPSELPVPGAK